MQNICKLLFKEKANKLSIVVIVILSAINSFIFSNIILISGNIINDHILDLNDSLFKEIHFIVSFSILWILFNAIFYIFTNTFIEKKLAKIRKEIASIILKGDISNLEENMQTGNISVRATSDIENLSNILTSDFIWFLRILMNAIFALISCIVLDFRLACVFIIFPISFFIIKKISKPIQARKRQSAKYIDTAMSIMAESIQGICTIKSFNLEQKVFNEFCSLTDKATNENIKNEKTGLIAIAANYVIQIIQLIVLLLFGIFMIYKNYILPGTFISMLLLSNNIRFAVKYLSDMGICLHETTIVSERILEVLNIKKTSNHENIFIDCKTNNNIIDIDNLTFSYGKENVLNQLSLHIKQGEKISIVGQSGSGKSTLIKLICGLFGNYSGEIKLYNYNIKDINKDNLHEQISIITQDPFIMNTSIYENIVVGNKNVSMEKVLNIIEKCSLKSLIESLPNGLNTVIGDQEINLSISEKQRISIARALLKDAPIIIMDEATSYLDCKTEETLYKSLESLLEQKTAIIISHKTNMLKFTDKTYFMKNGHLFLS